MSEAEGLIVGGVESEFRPAVLMGKNLPDKIDTQPVRYYWKEALLCGNYLDAEQKPFEISPQRIDALIENFNKAKANGFLPRVPHVPSGKHDEPGDNLGFIVDAKKNERGGLELLHQIIGEDAFKTIARNKSSIFTLYNAVDEHGNKYPELIEHNAVCGNPRLNNLKDFQPVLAASRGAVMAARVLTFAAPAKDPAQRSNRMDLTKLRDAIGAAASLSDDDVIAQAILKVSEQKTALALTNSTTANLRTEMSQVTQRATEAEGKLSTANQKIIALELANNPIPEPVLLRIGKTYERQIDQMLREGKCTKAQADLLKTEMKSGEKYDGLMMSRYETEKSPLDLGLKLLSLNKPFTGNNSMGQPVIDPNEQTDATKAAPAIVQAYLKHKYPGPQPAAAKS